ncbi:acetylcholine receptor subunit alpha-like 1 isoform X2 [Liolophura sinensis]|uniref:acetylcholine receptor subunit alpha-like 1 isoform X2 n=1 Tax=Liolophura sinensis TaxID=3198878 RepID=UPI0031584B2E
MHCRMLCNVGLFFTCWTWTISMISSLHKHEEMPAKRLHYDLFQKRKYEKLIRPSGKEKAALIVRLSMRIAQLLSIDEKNQIMTTSVWLRHEWYDSRLTWDPEEYSGVRLLKLPSEDLWRPDIVLYNNADGDFAITLLTKATVHYDGRLVWEPPAIIKSYCPIDVEFFPFDLQECFMKFGTWSYDGRQVNLHHNCTWNQTEPQYNETIVIARGISLDGFYPNVEWDVINVTARRKVKKYLCCEELYPDITFNVTLRRRTLFYSVNLIVPCMAISCLCVLVFYLPSDSCEKITLSISILLALTVFFLLLSDLIPPTSLVVPLIGKYLLFTSVVVTLSILLTVFVLSIHNRAPSTHTMSPWVKRVFTEILPKILLMRRPDMKRQSTVIERGACNGTDLREPSPIPEIRNATLSRHRKSDSDEERDDDGTYTKLRQVQRYPPEVDEALKGVVFIFDRMKKDDEEEEEKRDWKYVAMVMDRLFLYIFTLACFLGATCIFLTAPSLYDAREPMLGDDLSQICYTTIVSS